MKKFVAFLAALAFTGLAYGQSSVQGGGLSSKAIQALEECFDSSDNFICAASSGSSNTTVVNPPGGTTFKIPVWTGATTLGDSAITDFGTTMFIEPSNFLQIEPDGTGNTLFQLNPRPAAGTGADIFQMGFTLNAMNGGDTNNLFQISLTNANHTGASNFINAFNINSIIGDAEANETAVNIETGWENFMRVAEDISNEATFELANLTSDITYTFPAETGGIVPESLTRTGSVDVEVLDSGTSAVNGEQVFLNGRTGLTCVTAGAGTCTVSGVPEGVYMFSCTDGAAEEGATAPFVVSDGNITAITCNTA